MERLRVLEIFKSVADHGSFTRAADAMNIGIPTVSRAVQDLEELLAVQLFNRTTRRVTLTCAGEQILEHVGGVLESYEGLARAGSESALEFSGDIRIDAPAIFDTQRLAGVVAEFTCHYPKVRVDVRISDQNSETCNDLVELSVIVGKSVPPSCIARPLAPTQLGFYASPDYLQHCGANVTLAELDPRKVFVSGSQQISLTARHCVTGNHASIIPRGALRTNCPHAVIGAAAAGAGIAVVPEALASLAVARGTLVPVLAEWKLVPIETYLVYRTRRNQPSRVRKLTEYVIDAFAEEKSGMASQAPDQGYSITSEMAPFYALEAA